MYKIKELREKKGLTQKELGRLVGVGQSVVAQYESGQRTPSLRIAERLAKQLAEGDLNALMGRETA